MNSQDISLSFTEVNGGLFNYVYKINNNKNCISYLKIFTDKAKSDSFPPLPTSPKQRYFIAVECHKIAYEASLGITGVNVPKLINYSPKDYFVLMEEAVGTPLFDFLINTRSSPETILVSYEICMKWLAAMHSADCKDFEEIESSSNLFKEYKIDLQYSKLINFLPLTIQSSAKNFVRTYLNSKKQLVHGDLNSRNILIDKKDNIIISIIDFEQGHLGCGLYDVAYICCELVIRLLLKGKNDIELHINNLLKVYSNKLAAEEIIDYRKHLAFQVLYRLVGPSRKVWSGHLSKSETKAVKLWSINQLEKFL
jgi:tRNA A-37 threonylcarbamoyl transferase component Bud32